MVDADKPTVRILEVDAVGHVVHQRMKQVTLVDERLFRIVAGMVIEGLEHLPAFCGGQQRQRVDGHGGIGHRTSEARWTPAGDQQLYLVWPTGGGRIRGHR